MTRRGFKRPRNGHFAHYCGECAKWEPVDHEYVGPDYGRCKEIPAPDHAVSLAYFVTTLCRDQYEGACPLFEEVGA